MGFALAEIERIQPPKRRCRLKRIHTSTRLTMTSFITPRRYHLAVPSFSHSKLAFAATSSPSPFPNDSNSAKCLAHALPYSLKCINNPSFLFVTNITASTKPPSSQTLFLTNPLHSITYLHFSNPNTILSSYVYVLPLRFDDLSSRLGIKSCLSSALLSPLPPSGVHLK